MRQTLLTIAFIVFNIAFSSAAFLQKPMNPQFNIMTEIKALENESFGKKLFDTIALQMNSKAPLEDVAKLLQDLKSNLEDQQSKADKLQAERDAECKTEIANYKSRIAKANKEIEEATDAIATLVKMIEQLEAAIANKKVQLEIVNKREVKLNKDWAIDVASYKQRTAEHTEVIAALDIILPKLRGIPSGQVVTAKTLLVELAKVGHSNPIGALVQLAMTLDPKALGNVVDKLQAIRDSFAASLEDDKAAQSEASASFRNMITEIQTTRTNLENRLEQDEASLAENQSKKKEQETRLSDNQAELASAQKGLKEKEAQCDAWKAQYIKETKKRNDEIDVIIKVQEILATRLESMKEYLKTRVNQL